jgi:pyruvate dehydrogenase E1 component alpha subunit
MSEILELYRQMARARAFELAVGDLWERGRISGEMHLGTGEEAVAAGVVAHLRDGDGMALDHRGTPPLVIRGVDPVSLLREMLGQPDGLCGGNGGHMHLFAPEMRSMSSGIVGAAGPAAVGMAWSASMQRPGSVAVGFFGDGAINEGHVMEAMNLASAWKLPAVFVCKDNEWAITTRSQQMTGGTLGERAQGLGLTVYEADGLDVEEVHDVAGRAVAKARKGHPGFLHVTCPRLDGHFLGDQMVRVAGSPLSGEGRGVLGKSVRSALRREGGSVVARAGSLVEQMSLLARARSGQKDPLEVARKKLKKHRLDPETVDAAVSQEMQRAVEQALEGIDA